MIAAHVDAVALVYYQAHGAVHPMPDPDDFALVVYVRLALCPTSTHGPMAAEGIFTVLVRHLCLCQHVFAIGARPLVVEDRAAVLDAEIGHAQGKC
eukprot:5106117-Prymnesium_polylepis.2